MVWGASSFPTAAWCWHLFKGLLCSNNDKGIIWTRGLTSSLHAGEVGGAVEQFVHRINKTGDPASLPKGKHRSPQESGFLKPHRAAAKPDAREGLASLCEYEKMLPRPASQSPHVFKRVDEPGDSKILTVSRHRTSQEPSSPSYHFLASGSGQLLSKPQRLSTDTSELRVLSPGTVTPGRGCSFVRRLSWPLHSEL